MTPNPLRPIGGDFAIAWEVAPPHGLPPLFATGRDALSAIVSRHPKGDWLVPDFMCPVVPRVLEKYDIRPLPYGWQTPWSVDAGELNKLLPQASGIIVPYYLGLEPQADIWDMVKGKNLCVVEDRCQSVGAAPSAAALKGDYAIGSFRKWLPTPDGAYAIAKNGEPLLPTLGTNATMLSLRLAAALVKQAWLEGFAAEKDEAVEHLYVDLFAAGEEHAGSGAYGHAASAIAELLITRADMPAIAARRRDNQIWLANELQGCAAIQFPQGLKTDEAPLLALPVLSQARDALRRHLAGHAIYCPLQWKDGDWADRGCNAALWSAQLLSLPIDQRYNREDMQRIAYAIKDF